MSQLPQYSVFNSVDKLAENTLINELEENMKAFLDWGFLKQAFQEHNIDVQPLLIIDTFQIEKKRLHQQGHEIGLDDLTLSACRARYELPHYGCHHALTDAMATAELLLAQCHQISRGNELKLAELV